MLPWHFRHPSSGGGVAGFCCARDETIVATEAQRHKERASHRWTRINTDRYLLVLICANPCVSVADFFIGLKNKLYLREQIEQRLARIDVHLVGRAELDQIRWTISVRSRVDVPNAA